MHQEIYQADDPLLEVATEPPRQISGESAAEVFARHERAEARAQARESQLRALDGLPPEQLVYVPVGHLAALGLSDSLRVDDALHPDSLFALRVAQLRDLLV